MSLDHTLIILHIAAASIGLLSGFMAMAFRKGAGFHGAAGTVFFVSMLVMTGTSGILAGFLRRNNLNLVAATLTFYLVATGWAIAKRRNGGTNAFDVGAMLWVLIVGVFGLTRGLQGSSRGDGMPTPAYVIFGLTALLFAFADVRFLKRGGVTGAKRIVRHLWRMGLALLIATLSFYPGQAKLFTKAVRATNLLMIPHVLLIGALVFWLVRMQRRKRARPDVVVAETHDAALAA